MEDLGSKAGVSDTPDGVMLVVVKGVELVLAAVLDLGAAGLEGGALTGVVGLALLVSHGGDELLEEGKETLGLSGGRGCELAKGER